MVTTGIRRSAQPRVRTTSYQALPESRNKLSITCACSGDAFDVIFVADQRNKARLNRYKNKTGGSNACHLPNSILEVILVDSRILSELFAGAILRPKRTGGGKGVLHGAVWPRKLPAPAEVTQSKLLFRHCQGQLREFCLQTRQPTIDGTQCREARRVSGGRSTAFRLAPAARSQARNRAVEAARFGNSGRLDNDYEDGQPEPQRRMRFWLRLVKNAYAAIALVALVQWSIACSM